jgi:hypothetical protein
MRFRKSIKIAPGLKINISKSGVSTTIGGKGLSTNIGKNGAYLNTGIPGTGVSSRHKIAGTSDLDEETTQEIAPEVGKTGKRVMTVIGLLFLIVAFVCLISKHPVWAFLAVSFGLGILFYPALSDLVNRAED